MKTVPQKGETALVMLGLGLGLGLGLRVERGLRGPRREERC
jgi:hypothetical protein